MTTPDLDVLIAGAGPVGTVLAIDLRRRGLTVRIIDKAADEFDGSRAKGIQPRSLEVFDDLGVLDDVAAGGSTYPLMGIHLGPITLSRTMIRTIDPTDDVPYPNTWMLPQFRTDHILHAKLRQHGVQVEYRSALVDLTQTLKQATATVDTPNGTEIIAARYVVGADGGASAVRKHCDIGFVGATDEADRWLIVDTCVRAGLSRDRWHVWPRLGGRLTTACPLPNSDLFQWMIRLGGEEPTPADDVAIASCIRRRTGNKKLQLGDIVWKSEFRPNIRLAQHYRRDRVFIAGDAAHVHTPMGGQGLNTGIQDSYNLSWKLAQVIAGAPPQLLDSYEAERQPIAAAVLGLSTKKYQGIAKLDPSSMRRGKDEQQLSLSYHGGPLASTSAERTTTLQTGDRAPDGSLQDSAGTALRLFDLYRGPHFTALAIGRGAAEALRDLAWPDRGAALQRITIDAPLPGDSTTHNLRDTDRNVHTTYGTDRDTLLLIRPDGYIASIATDDILSATTAVVARLTP